MPNNLDITKQSVKGPQRGLFVGRFQPFHMGHLHAIEYILKDVEEIVIGVASIESNFTWNDPFTCGERIEMIWSSLDQAFRQRCLIVPIANLPNNRMWPSYVIQLLPCFHIAFTNNILQIILMDSYGIPTRPIEFIKRNEFQGNEIRSLLLEKSDLWVERVPPPVTTILKRINAQARMGSLKML